MAQVLLGARSEVHWIRYARIHLAGMFPYLPQRPGYNKRLRAALPLIKKTIRELARDSDFWLDNHRIVDSTPIPCACPAPRSNPRTRPAGMPILWALANPKIGEREVLASMLQVEAGVVAEHDGILLISDKDFAFQPFEKRLAEQGIELLRPFGNGRRPATARRYSRRSGS